MAAVSVDGLESLVETREQEDVCRSRQLPDVDNNIIDRPRELTDVDIGH